MGSHHGVLDLAITFFSISLHPDSQDQFAFTWDSWQWTYQLVTQRYVHSLTTSQGMITQESSIYPLPTLVKCFQYTGDAMLTTEDFPLLQHYLEGLCSHMCD